MLTPKQLLVETAKFFSLNPDRWITGSLKRGSGDTACYCAVGYMGHLMRNDPATAPLVDRLGDYNAVTRFLQPIGLADNEIVSKNDNADGPEEVVDFLKDQLVNA
jgi:hypothetical protein